MSRLTRLLPKLREAQAQREHALQAAAQEATGLSPGDRVKITAGSATGRRGTVIEVTTQKITVTQVEGLLSNERLQLQPNEVQRL